MLGVSQPISLAFSGVGRLPWSSLIGPQNWLLSMGLARETVPTKRLQAQAGFVCYALTEEGKNRLTGMVEFSVEQCKGQISFIETHLETDIFG